jgi:hypothetical protein
MNTSPNIWLSKSEADLEQQFGTPDYFIAHIDGTKTATLRQFYEEIADLLEFPIATFNLDALNDALNDLQWLEDEKIVLYITNTESFISKERDPAKLGSVLQIMDATAEDWKWVETDDLMDRKEFYVVLEDSQRIRDLLDNELMSYDYLTARNI